MSSKTFSELNSDVISSIADGKVGVVPTDTVYGLVASAHDEKASKAMHGLKGRENKPGTLIAASIDQLVNLGIKRRYLKAVEHLWPNPLSIIIPTGDKLDYLHLGKKTLAVRIPKNKKLLSFLKKTGPLITTSANSPGQKPAENIEQAKKYFGDKVDFYVDGGEIKNNVPSTIIRVIDDEIDVVRQGAYKV